MTRWVRCLVPLSYSFTDLFSGQLEDTISAGFHRAANLRALLTKADTPDALKRCEPIFSKLVDPGSNGTVLHEMVDLSSRVHDININGSSTGGDEESIPTPNHARRYVKMPGDLRHAFCSSGTADDEPGRAYFVSQTDVSGFTHSTKQRHQGNSQVLYRSPSHSKIVPGFIESIFTPEHDDRQFLAVRHLLPSPVKDPFQDWPFLKVKMYDNALGDLEVILPENIQVQFASCPLEWDGVPTIAVVSLAKVRTSMFQGSVQRLIYFGQDRRDLSRVEDLLYAQACKISLRFEASYFLLASKMN